MDGIFINDCGGFFQDSGGGFAGYGLNENFMIVICSDGLEGIYIQLVFFSIDIGELEMIIFYDFDGLNLGMEFDVSFLMFFDNFFIVQVIVVNISGCLIIVFIFDGVDSGNMGWSVDINCIINCQLIIVDLVSISLVVMFVDIGWIDICFGDCVEFVG